MARIVNSDNYGGDYPNESFLNLPLLQAGRAELIANAINFAIGEDGPRYYKVVPDDYVLQPGFEP